MVNEAGKETGREALPLTVLYDGACPLCRREIGVYRGLQPMLQRWARRLDQAALERPSHRDAGS